MSRDLTNNQQDHFDAMAEADTQAAIAAQVKSHQSNQDASAQSDNALLAWAKRHQISGNLDQVKVIAMEAKSLNLE